jgi:subfamily B ATP-binding cassette protein MsbA
MTHTSTRKDTAPIGHSAGLGPEAGRVSRQASFISRVRTLIRLADAPAWSAPAIVGLGLLSALLEGIGLSLFIPLVELLGAQEGGTSILTRAFDTLLAPVPIEWRVAVVIGGLCLSILLKNVVAQLNQYVTQYVNGQVAHNLRVKVLQQTIDSCVDYGIENRRSDIVTTLANNTWTIGSTLMLVHRMAVCSITVLVFATLMFAVSAPLSAVALAGFAMIAVAIGFATRRAHDVGQQVVAENRAFGMRVWENITSLRLIRAFSREQDELRRFADASDAVRRRLLQMTMLWSLPTPISEVLGIGAIAALILAGNSFGLGVASLAAFLALLYRMQVPVRELMTARVAFDGSSAAIADVDDFLERTRKPFLRDGDLDFGGLRQSLSLRGVNFRYPGSEALALSDVSLDLMRGATTAIVGRSGAGKSTLMDLLFRFRDPTTGQVLVDGVPLDRLRIASWRSRVAVMSQDVHLLNDSVAVNIAYGKPGAGLDEVRAAAGVAGADGFIQELPARYDTIVGDGGIRLSGGQRQRIALARTILRNPDVLLLDEATNALDNETEREFQSALRQYAKGRTVIVIAHRLSTVEAADQIVVLDSGKVVEIGPPEHLLRARGAFARLHGLHAGVSEVGAA